MIFLLVVGLFVGYAYRDVCIRTVLSWLPLKWQSEKTIYKQIADIRHPSIEDYLLIQKYLKRGERPLLVQLKDYEHICRRFRLMDESGQDLPRAGVVHVNCEAEEKENCILLYASFNRNYPQALARLIDKIAQSDFKGHILYRIGGWTNVEGGDLIYAHVPYAFKVCFFREAQRLGYQRALWLDAAIVPLCSLNELFSQIQKEGYLAVGNTHMVGPYCNAFSAAAMGSTLEECAEIPSCSAGIFGLDFSNEVAVRAFSLWQLAMRDPNAFFSSRPEQNALSIILYQLGMNRWLEYNCLAERKEWIGPGSLFFIDREFAHTGINHE